MRQKAWAYSFIFLVIFQLFSPWMLSVSMKGLAIEKNTALAAGEVFTPIPQIGYIKDYKVTVGGKTTTLPGLVFMYVDTLEASGECYSKDVNFYIYNVVDYFPDWQAWDETVDSQADCGASNKEWHTEKIMTSNGGNQVQTIRQYYGTSITGFDRRIAIEHDLGNLNIVVNKDKVYGDDTEEILLTKTTKSFGPTPSQTILDWLSTGASASEQALHGTFSSTISSSSFLSDADQDKIVGEFNIKIQNKGTKWQDNGDKIGVADEDDDYGAWDTVYDDELLTGQAAAADLTPDNDGATGRGAAGNGFDGFIFDISDSKDFKGKSTMSINLNKLILEGKENGVLALFSAGDLNLKVVSGFDPGKSVLAAPDEAIGLTEGLKENTKYFYRVRIYPDNLREGLFLGGVLVPEDAYIVSSGEMSVPAKNSLGVVQNSRSGTSVALASDQEDSPDWLPSCGIDPRTWFQGCLVVAFYYLFFKTSAYLLALAGSIMDWVLVYSISPDVYKVGYIVDGWRFIRDVCNLFFIFMLIYLAFRIILGIGHGAKKMVVNTILVAILINFSYPLTTVVIDVSNITARQLYYNAFTKRDATNNKPVGLSTLVASGYNPQKMVLGAQETSQNKDENKGSIFMIILMGVVFNVIGMLLFLKVALQFIYRILGLVFAIILSPLAIFSNSLDEKQRGKLKMVGFEQWMGGLLSDAFKAPVFLFLILILALFIGNNPFQNIFGSGVDGIDWWMSLIIPFMMIIGFLFLIEKVTKSMSSGLADMASSYVMKGVGAVAGVAMGGVALAGSSTIGKLATRFASSGVGQKLFDKAAGGTGIGGWAARRGASLVRATQQGSFDLRQTGVGNAISREAGMNLNLGASMIGLGTAATVGGYMGTVERRNQKRDEFVKMLEWNKNLAADLEARKKAKEEEKARLEADGKDQRAGVTERERDLKESERAKKEADERFAELEKLEDLLAKRNDLIAQNRPTNEIDVQIGRVEAKVIASAPPALQQAVTQNGGVLSPALLTQARTAAQTAKDSATSEKEQDQMRLDIAKRNLKANEDAMRQLDRDMNELTKAIKNVKENRKNLYAHRIRNKSGGIFHRTTYGEDAHGHQTPLTADQARAFGPAGHFNDITGQMRDIITSVDEHAHGVNEAFNRRVRLTSLALGTLAGAFTGGAGAIAVGAMAGGLVGLSRSYRPDNEHYGVAHDPNEWHPHPHDTYVPGTRPGGGSGGGGGGAHPPAGGGGH